MFEDNNPNMLECSFFLAKFYLFFYFVWIKVYFITELRQNRNHRWTWYTIIGISSWNWEISFWVISTDFIHWFLWILSDLHLGDASCDSEKLVDKIFSYMKPLLKITKTDNRNLELNSWLKEWLLKMHFCWFFFFFFAVLWFEFRASSLRGRHFTSTSVTWGFGNSGRKAHKYPRKI
jgi:hypothetical protein